MASWGSVANNIQGAFHQVVPFDNRTYKTNQAASAKYDYKPPSASAPKAQNTPSTPSGQSATDRAIAALQAQLAQGNAALAATRAQIAAMPRLPAFDSNSAWQRAQNTAASTVNPVYQDKLNRYLEKAKAALGQETTTRTRNKQDISTALTQALEDTLMSRQRTEEDVTNKLGDITADENSFQRQEGRQFDAARTALLGDVANAGLTESGMGQGIVQDAVVSRNLASEDQVRGFTNEKRDTNIFKTRTLADLDKTDTRERGGAARRTENEDIALRNFIEMQSFEEGEFRAENEYNRLQDIAGATGSAYSQIVRDTIAALAGSGARAQDIQLFQQIYG